MLRDRIRQGVARESVVASIQSGALAPDEVVNRLVEIRLGEADAARGFVLDGYPRTMAQADHLQGLLEGRGEREVVIYLAVDYNIVIARLTGRRQCPRCGTLYNLATQPPRVEGRCDRDGERLVIREDDKESVIRERLDAYERQTRPVLEYYKESGRRVIEVNASNDPPEVVFGKICQAIEANDRS
jgi:adenylate kinase